MKNAFGGGGRGEFGSHKIAWVKCGSMCKSKIERRLGVKDVKNFNLALLCKWL